MRYNNFANARICQRVRSATETELSSLRLGSEPCHGRKGLLAEPGWGLVGFSLFGCFFHRLSRRAGGRELGDEHSPGRALQTLPRARGSAAPGVGKIGMEKGLDQPQSCWASPQEQSSFPKEGLFQRLLNQSHWDPSGTRDAEAASGPGSGPLLLDVTHQATPSERHPPCPGAQ